jgi:hypothetical protein
VGGTRPCVLPRGWCSTRPLGTYEGSSRRSPTPRGSAGNGRSASCGARSCPSSARMMSGSRTSMRLMGTAARRSPKRCSGMRSGPARSHEGRYDHESHPEGERAKPGLALIRETLGTLGLPDGLPNLKPKNLVEQSGRRDLNPRPLDPQSRTTRLTRSDGVGRGASHLRQRPEAVVGSLSESTRVGSRSWLPRREWSSLGRTPH